MESKHQKNSVEGIAIAVAGAWKECPECKGISTYPEVREGHLYVGKCATCKGTGRVYALDPEGTIGVRVDCGCGQSRERARRGTSCWRCNARGWVPTTDAWKLIEAAYPAFIKGIGKSSDKTWTLERHGIDRREQRWEHGPDLKEAFFEALSKALIAQGYTLGGE